MVTDCSVHRWRVFMLGGVVSTCLPSRVSGGWSYASRIGVILMVGASGGEGVKFVEVGFGPSWGGKGGGGSLFGGAPGGPRGSSSKGRGTRKVGVGGVPAVAMSSGSARGSEPIDGRTPPYFWIIA